MKLKTLTVAIIFSSSMSYATSFIPNKSDYFYEIGQSSSFLAPVDESVNLKIGGNISSYGTGTCFRFNRIFSIKESFKNIKKSVVSSIGPVLEGIQSSVVGLAMYKIQQLNPGLYDIVQNSNFDFNEEFNLKVSNCQKKMENLEKGGGLFDEIISVSDTQGYLDAIKRDAKGDEEVDLISTTNDLEKDKGKWGIPWIHRNKGNSGGYNGNQKPIKLVSDVILAGVNVLSDISDAKSRDLDDESAIPNGSRIKRYWDKPQDAINWGVYVLGDVYISSKEQSESRKAHVGLGLSSILNDCPNINSSNDDHAATCVKNVRDYLWQLVNSGSEPTDEELISISPENYAITSDVITTIQSLKHEDKIVAISTLSEKIATQNVINEALMLKRVFSAGMKVPEVQNINKIHSRVSKIKDELDSEIKSLTFEHEARQKMMASTLRALHNIREELKAKGQAIDDAKADYIKHGAIYKKLEGGKKQ